MVVAYYLTRLDEEDHCNIEKKIRHTNVKQTNWNSKRLQVLLIIQASKQSKL